MRVRHLGQICVGPSLSRSRLNQLATTTNSDQDIQRRVTIHRLLAGETRYKLIKLLSQTNELCVCDMAEIIATTVSAVSHQLRILRQAKVVTTRRQGQTIYYSLADSTIARLL